MRGLEEIGGWIILRLRGVGIVSIRLVLGWKFGSGGVWERGAGGEV